MTTKRRERHLGLGFALAILLSFLTGFMLIYAQHLYAPALEAHFGTIFVKSPNDLTQERLLLKAESPELNYRSASFGIQPNTPLHASLMAEQPRIISAYQHAAEAAKTDPAPPSDFPWKVETFFSRTVQAGPLSSILRTDYLQRGQNARQPDYASTLINSLSNDPFQLADLFVPTRTSKNRLDRTLCLYTLAEKQRRTGSRSVFGEAIDCQTASHFSFLDGPPVVFTDSTKPNRIGGLNFYFAPGRLGPPSEGEYIIQLPQHAFRKELRPQWASFFDGEPPNAS